MSYASLAEQLKHCRDTAVFYTSGGGVSEPGEDACKIPKLIGGQPLQLVFLSPPLSPSASVLENLPRGGGFGGFDAEAEVSELRY